MVAGLGGRDSPTELRGFIGFAGESLIGGEHEKARFGSMIPGMPTAGRVHGVSIGQSVFGLHMCQRHL